MSKIFFLAFAFIALQSCAVHYYDTESGAEHIWGVGHMVMKATVPNEGIQAVVQGTDTFGVGIGKGKTEYYLTIGLEGKRRIEVVNENTAVRFEWPDSDFLNVRVGSKWPEIYNYNLSKENQKK